MKMGKAYSSNQGTWAGLHLLQPMQTDLPSSKV